MAKTLDGSVNNKKDGIAHRYVVIGGGTGSFTVLQAVKAVSAEVTALVSMADDGGSSGVLRDELGALPPGDVRQCLVALSDTPHLRDLFNYRFDTGSLAGHSFGNLLLTALEKQTGSFAQAVKTASEVLNITGRVVPITFDNVRLVATTADGRRLHGEHQVDTGMIQGQQLPQLTLEPNANINPEAQQAIEQAEVVIIAPGDLYTSLAPALLVEGVGHALARTSAKVVYICNLVTKPGHTEQFDVRDHAAEIERFAGVRMLDIVLYNTAQPEQDLLRRYENEGEPLVALPHETIDSSYELRGLPLLGSRQSPAQPASVGDKLAKHRSYIRHDPVLLQQAIGSILKTS